MHLSCLLRGHDEPLVLERYERDAHGDVARTLKHELRWRCPRCFRIVSTTELKPNVRLMRRLRVQVGRRLKLVA